MGPQVVFLTACGPFLFCFSWKGWDAVKKREFFNYANPRYAPLRDPMREVVRSYWAATQYYAGIKERVWGEYGMVYLSRAIHTLEHKQPERIDRFASIMRQEGLELEYPGVPELDELLDNLDEVFRVCIELNDNIDRALQWLIDTADRRSERGGGRAQEEAGRFPALAREAEQLQVENSADRTKLLECWSMWNSSSSISSFDKWVQVLYQLPDGGEEDNS